MLPERWSRLLTAYVDGELGPREHQLVRRMLRQSPEARELLQQLRQDAQALQALPRRVADKDLSRRVLQAIADQGVAPARRPAAARAPLPVWLGVAAAAAVLLVIGTSAYLYFTPFHSAPDDSLAGPTQPLAPNLPDRLEGPELVELPRPDAELLPQPPALYVEEELLPSPPRALVGGPGVKSPRDPNADLATTPLPKPGGFQEVTDDSLALILKMRELDQEKPSRQLREELRKATAFRVEIACPENLKGFERLQTAFQANGLRLVLDPAAEDRMKRYSRTHFVLYTENIAPEELMAVLQRAGSEDRKAERRRRGDGQFDRVIVNRMTAHDYAELSKMLGIDADEIQKPRPRVVPRMDVRKPLPMLTTAQVERALKGQLPPRPQPGPLVNGTERTALVLPYNPSRPRPASSPQVKRFLDNRQERKDGTLQVLLVLRSID